MTIRILLLILIPLVGLIFVVRSKWFDDLIKKMMRGTKTETSKELQADKLIFDKNKKNLTKNLAKEQERLEAELDKLEQLDK